MNIKEINEEIFYTQDSITKVSSGDIEYLKDKAVKNKRKRVRLCSHLSTDDTIHEMLIVFYGNDTYIRPHKHIGKSESFHLIEGKLNVVVFDDSGRITDVIRMAAYGRGDNFFYRLSDSRFHTVVPFSEYVIFHETTNGPFRRGDTVFAPWAPQEDDIENQEFYLKDLRSKTMSGV